MGVSTKASTGSRGAVRIGEETLYGVAVAPTHILDFTTESLSATENIIESESIREDRGRHKLIRGNLDVQGDISFEQSFGGFGMVFRHALGDYVRLPGADGGVRGRMAQDDEDMVAIPDDGTEKYIIEMLPDQSSVFGDSEALVAVIYRDSNNDLVADDNSNNGFEYTEYCGNEQTYITAVDLASDAYTGYSTTSVVELTLAAVTDERGNAVPPDFNTEGGIVYLGENRTRHKYFEYVPATAGSSKMYLDPASTDPGGAEGVSGNPSVGDAAIGAPCLTHSGASIGITAAAVKKGTWIYEFNPAWMGATYGGTGDDDATVFTHHIERGRELPVGLTVEVNRDAAIFLYTGMRVSTINWSFDANAIVTGSVTLMGQQEYAMANLVGDAIPGDTSITIDDSTCFPSGGGMITIGEETEITYTGITNNNNGTWTLTGIPANGDGSIERLHLDGENVDSRSTTEAGTTYEANSSPLTAFETLVYHSGAWEEVLSASVTLNNNLNGDKYGLGSRFRFALVEEQAVVEASLTMEFDDGKHYQKFKTGEFFTLELKAVSESSDSEIGTTGVLSGAYYFLPKCKYTGTGPQISGPSFIQHDMPCTCVVDDDNDTTDLVVVLVNKFPNDVSVSGT